MRKMPLKIAVALFAFIIGTAFSAFWFIYPSGLNRILQADAVLVEEDEEYAVYSVAINELFIKEKDSVRLLIISNQTSFFGNEEQKAIYGEDYFNNTDSLKRIIEMKEYYPHVSEEALFDFDVKKMHFSNLSHNFNLSVGYSLINEKELESVGKNQINVFSEKYEASGMIRLSRVGFNKDKTQAFLYVEYLFCPLCSQSDHLLLEKVNGSWTIKEVFRGMRS